MLGIVPHVLSDLEANLYGPRSPRNSDGSRHYCCFSPAILPVLGHRGSVLRMPLVEYVGATELRVAGVILRMLRRQAAVRSGGGFLRKSLSALGDRCWSKTSGKCKKPCDVESRTYTKRIMLACIPPLWVACRRVFSQCLLIALSSKMYHPPYYSPSLPGASCLEVSGGNHWISCGERAKLMSWDCVMHVGPLKARGNGCCSCWTTWPWYWALQSAAVAPQISTTRVAKSVSSLLQRSPSLSADGLLQKVTWPTTHLVQSVTGQTCVAMLTNVGRLQRGQPLTRSYFPSSQPKPHELPVKKRKLERETGPKTTRRKRTCTNSSPRGCGESGLPALPLWRVVLPRAEPSHRSHGSAPHGHAQRVSGLFENDDGRAKAVGKVGRDVVEMLERLFFQGHGHGARDYLMAAVKFDGWIQSFSDLLHAMRALKGYRRLAPGISRGLLPRIAAAAMMGVAMVTKDE